MSEITYYKVVLNSGGRFYSAQITGAYQLEYVQDEWTEATIGELFLFKSKLSADTFVGVSPGSLEVWECNVKDVRTPTVALQDSVIINAATNKDNLKVFRSFWTCQRIMGYTDANRYGENMAIRPPTGTLLAKKIKILRLA